MMNMSQIGKAVSWNAIDLLGRNGLNFVVLIVLAGILSPADFGLVAMLALFVAIAGLLVDSGFSQALIQRQQTTPTDESTIFFFTLAMGALIALLLFLVAPWIATSTSFASPSCPFNNPGNISLLTVTSYPAIAYLLRLIKVV